MAELSELFVKISTKLDPTGLDDTIKKVEDASKRIENISAGIKTLGVALTGYATSGIILISDLVKSISGQELAEAKLVSALKQTGQYSDKLFSSYTQLANQIQLTTKFSDDMTVSAQALMTRLGVMPADMEKSTIAATNLASALGIDLQTAAMLVGKAAAGNTALFSRYGIVLDETKVQSEGFGYVLGEISKKFGGAAQAEAETFSGKIEKLKNQFDDLKEVLGAAILPILTNLVTKIINTIVAIKDNLSPNLTKMIGYFLLGTTAIAGILGPIALLLGFLPQIVTGIISVNAVVGKAGFIGIAIAATAAIIGLVEAIDIWIDKISKAAGDEAEAMKTTEGKIKQLKEERQKLHEAMISGKLKGDAALEAAEKVKKYTTTIMQLQAELDKEKVKTIDTAVTKVEQNKIVTEDVQKNLEQQQKYIDSLFKFQIETNQLSLADQRAMLEEQLSNVENGTVRELELKKELYELDKKENEARNYSIKTGFIAAIEEMQLKQTNFADYTTRLMGNWQNNISDGIVKLVDGGLSSWEKFGDVMATIGDTMKTALIKVIADISSEWILKTGLMKAATVLWAGVEWAATLSIAAVRVMAGWATIPWVGIALGAVAIAALFSEMEKFKNFAQGGLVLGKTLAMIGESGSEVVLPLNSPQTSKLLSQAMDNSTNFGGGIIVNVNGGMGNRRQAREQGEIVATAIFDRLKMNRRI